MASERKYSTKNVCQKINCPIAPYNGVCSYTSKEHCCLECLDIRKTCVITEFDKFSIFIRKQALKKLLKEKEVAKLS